MPKAEDAKFCVGLKILLMDGEAEKPKNIYRHFGILSFHLNAGIQYTLC